MISDGTTGKNNLQTNGICDEGGVLEVPLFWVNLKLVQSLT